MATVAVLNAGGWGTALAIVLARNGHRVSLWARRPEQAALLASSRLNETYLPGVPLPDGILPTADLAEAVAGCDAAVLVPISAGLRELAHRLGPLLPDAAQVVHGTKGLERDSLLRLSQVVESELRPAHRGRVAALSGPTHAEEVGRGIPTAAVVACADRAAAESLQAILTSQAFRIYTNTDVVGVELCGALKNVVALATGVGDGLGGGDNGRAALMTRSLAEIGRLVVAAGGRAETVAGLAGVGDLVATCTSRHSRNRRAGESIGKGMPLEAVLAQSAQVVEGVPATRAALALARRYGVSMPIVEQANAVLFEGRDPRAAMAELMARDPTAEGWGGVP
ncbi:MAG: NAD(P)-dependent glycerol-3-phosphate dehydrogenase [Chloroflexi bacterium]|nr:NAD(P)-dependent glycerol-3-phosphate dehydrogenase [Chloroflexota bacterium]